MKTSVLRTCGAFAAGGVILASFALGQGAETQSKTRTQPTRAPNAAAIYAKQKTELNRQIKEVSAAAGNPLLQDVAIESIAKHTKNSVDSLLEVKRKSAMGYGDLVAAYAIAEHSGTKFDQIRLERRTRSWADSAAIHRVSLTQVLDKLSAVLADVDKFIKLKDEESMLRAEGEMRRMDREMRMRGFPVPPPDFPPPPDGPDRPDEPPRER